MAQEINPEQEKNCAMWVGLKQTPYRGDTLDHPVVPVLQELASESLLSIVAPDAFMIEVCFDSQSL